MMAQRKHKAKMGRPPLLPHLKRGMVLSIRITRGERARMEAEADKAGLSLAELLMRPWREG